MDGMGRNDGIVEIMEGRNIVLWFFGACCWCKRVHVFSFGCVIVERFN